MYSRAGPFFLCRYLSTVKRLLFSVAVGRGVMFCFNSELRRWSGEKGNKGECLSRQHSREEQNGQEREKQCRERGLGKQIHDHFQALSMYSSQIAHKKITILLVYDMV